MQEESCGRPIRPATTWPGRVDRGTINTQRGSSTPAFSGFIVIRLQPGLADDRASTLPELTAYVPVSNLVATLPDEVQASTRRLVRSISPADIRSLEQEAMTTDFPPLHSLTTYWIVDCRGMTDPELRDLVDRLNRLPEVDLAYLDGLATNPVQPTDDPWNFMQDYLDPAPCGVDARWAWTQAGGDGSGVGFVDLEQEWFVGHEDLVAKAPARICGDNRFSLSHDHHGTAVLGIVVGTDNKTGVVGIATGVTSVRLASHYQDASKSNGHVADAIAAAVNVMAAGDILLLEVQKSVLPTETFDGDLDAIRVASARGIVVIEAAGDNGTNLDAWSDPVTGARLRRSDPSIFVDSGAIVVGAGESANQHRRLTTSNYGSRVDCYAWGDCIVSAGFGDLAGSPHTDIDLYTNTFGQTSGAAAIVAGCALVVQAMYQHSAHTRLSPGQMRAILSMNGTPQDPGRAGNIGVMPDLCTIGQKVLGLVPDVYLRDYVGDDGSIPSSGTLSTSPDIIVQPNPVANPTASFGEGSGTEQVDTLGSKVRAGQDNNIYVRMRNRGGDDAIGVTATVYWSKAATLVMPKSWNLIGTTFPVSVPKGKTLTVAGPLKWPRASLPPAGTHACFIGILANPRDPAPILPPQTDWAGFVAFIRNNNNVAWRNFDVIDIVLGPKPKKMPAAFLVAGADDEARQFDLEITQDLPSDVQLDWRVPLALLYELPSDLRASAKLTTKYGTIALPRTPTIRLRDVLLRAGARHASRFVVNPGPGLAAGMHRIAIRQVWEGVEVGGITWALRPKGDVG
jgi:serine protease